MDIEDSDKEPEDIDIDKLFQGFADTVSYYIYNENEEDAWIRSTLTIEQTIDEDGFELLKRTEWLDDLEYHEGESD